MCEKSVPFLYWPFAPYIDWQNSSESLDGVILRIFNQSYVTCCGRPMNVVFREVDNQVKLLDEIQTKPQAYAMPVMVPHLAIQNVPLIFIRVLDHPGLAMVTHPPELTSNFLLSGLKNVWPLLAALIILAGYASLIFWLAEFSADKPAFSRKFHYGYFQAFWYCLISATTVGYGDKVPQSKVGKFFGVVWILLGVCIVSAFTASITTLMSQMQIGLLEKIEISSSNPIGVIRGTIDEYLVVQAGGQAVTGRNLEELATFLSKDNKNISTKIVGVASDPHHLRVFNEDYFSGSFETQQGATGPVSVGYLVKVNNDSVLRCFKQQAFFRQLEVNDWINKFTDHGPHVIEDKAELAASSIMRDTDKNDLIIAASVLVVLFFIVWMVELILNRYKGGKSSEPKLSTTNTTAFNDEDQHTMLTTMKVN